MYVEIDGATLRYINGCEVTIHVFHQQTQYIDKQNGFQTVAQQNPSLKSNTSALCTVVEEELASWLQRRAIEQMQKESVCECKPASEKTCLSNVNRKGDQIIEFTALQKGGAELSLHHAQLPISQWQAAWPLPTSSPWC